MLYGHIQWPKVKPYNDANLVDIPFLGRLLIEGMEHPTALPTIPPSLETVQRIEDFVSGAAIRSLPRPTLYERYLVASNDSPLWFADAAELWLGCIGMAKLTRVSYVGASGTTPYSLGLRLRGYRWLRRQVNSLKSHRIVWGMTLAQELSRSRGNEVVNDWVPPASPYWLSFKGRL